MQPLQFATQGPKDLEEHVLNADIVVGAVGIPRFIQSNWVKNGAVVIDAGYHPEKCGDIDLEPLIDRCSAYTPVPGRWPDDNQHPHTANSRSLRKFMIEWSS